MRRADGIDVEPFHQLQITFHIGKRHRRALFGMKIVAVHAAEFDGFSVEQILAVPDFHAANPDFFKNFLAGANDFQII